MKKKLFVCAVFGGLLACWSLSFAQTYKEYYDKGEAAYEAKEDYGKAVEYYTEILKTQPERLDAIYVRGVYYFRLKKYDEALADFNKIKDVDQIYHRVLHHIGLINNEKKIIGRPLTLSRELLIFNLRMPSIVWMQPEPP